MYKVAFFIKRKKKWKGLYWLKRKVLNPETNEVVKVQSLPKEERDKYRPRKPGDRYIDRSYWLNKHVNSPITGEKAMVRSLPLRYRDSYRPDIEQEDKSQKLK
jgi:hypothetical protein